MPNNDYSLLMRLLHNLALGVPAITRASFDIQQLSGRFDCESIIDRRHVFITGLARSGTTLLLRRLADSQQFRSLTYRDMPFPLMPRIWERLSSPFSIHLSKKQRAHGDQIQVDADSPEALEEVFWRTYCAPSYIKSNALIPMQATDDIIEKFRCYIASVLPDDNENLRYLSKNNNNILRLETIRKVFPSALILIPFRNPFTHASSLLSQHQRFIKTHNNDPFSRKYMNWLAHHEFGADQRPFIFHQEMADKLAQQDASSILYWLILWTETYNYLLREGQRYQAIFFDYDDFCAQPEIIWSELARLSGIKTDIAFTDEIKPSQTKPKVINHLPDSLKQLIDDTYTGLKERAKESIYRK